MNAFAFFLAKKTNGILLNIKNALLDLSFVNQKLVYLLFKRELVYKKLELESEIRQPFCNI
jgi:predicted transcriptional regulator